MRNFDYIKDLGLNDLYYMKNIEVPERTSLFELVDGEPFREFINDDRVMMAVHYVRKVGNIHNVIIPQPGSPSSKAFNYS